jgi:Ca2+/H+ antiporter, TMEM165/GDT1 family
MTEGIMAVNDMLEGILVSFLAVGLAEIGDKTQLSVLLLASRTNKYFQLLLGVFLAFLLADGFTILVGSWITTMVPIDTLKLVSAVIFVIFGILRVW